MSDIWSDFCCLRFPLSVGGWCKADTDLDSKLSAHRYPHGEDDGGNEAAAVEQRDTQALAVVPRRDARETGDTPE